jgi:predicted RecB family endonuclease
MNSLKSILAAVDLDERSADYVLESARQLAPDTPIEVIHVLERNAFYNLGDPSAAVVDDLQGRMVREIGDYLTRLCDRHGIKRHALLEGHAATSSSSMPTRRATI